MLQFQSFKNRVYSNILSQGYCIHSFSLNNYKIFSFTKNTPKQQQQQSPTSTQKNPNHPETALKSREIENQSVNAVLCMQIIHSNLTMNISHLMCMFCKFWFRHGLGFFRKKIARKHPSHLNIFYIIYRF